jgi:Fe-S-cluster containining protein
MLQVQKPTPYKCDECGKFCSKETNLWRHLRYTHKLTSEMTKARIDEIRIELEKKEIFPIKVNLKQ